MTRSIRAAGVVAMVAALAGSQAAGAANDAKAEEVLGKMREAIGGSRLASLESVSIAGTYQRSMGGQQVGGEIALDVLLPDKFRRADTMELPMGGPGPTVIAAMNGSDAWRDVENPPSLGHGVMVVRRPAAPGAASTQSVKAEFQRLAIALFGNTSLLPLQVTYGGLAESDEGRAHMLTLKGEEDFAAQLFVDTESHLPLMLTYRAPAPQVRMQTMQRGPGHGQPADRARREEEARRAAADQPVALADYQLFLGEHRRVDGLMLPQRVTVQIDGKPAEQWEFTTVKVNQPIKAELFVKKPSEK